MRFFLLLVFGCYLPAVTVVFAASAVLVNRHACRVHIGSPIMGAILGVGPDGNLGADHQPDVRSVSASAPFFSLARYAGSVAFYSLLRNFAGVDVWHGYPEQFYSLGIFQVVPMLV